MIPNLGSNGMFLLFGLVVAMMVVFGSYAWLPFGKKGRGGRRDYKQGEENYMPNDGSSVKPRPQSDQSKTV